MSGKKGKALKQTKKGILAEKETKRNSQPNGPAEVQCDVFRPDFWVEFWEVSFSRVNFSGGLFCWKNGVENFDPRDRVQNSGVQNSFHRIRP